MRVVDVQALPLRAPAPDGATYWGARAWADDSGTQPGTYPPAARRRPIYSGTIDTVLVRVETDDSVVGWGECKAPVAPGATARIVQELLTPLVLGSSLDEIVPTWERMYAGMRVRGHDSGFWLEAISGVDIALWDAWGRTLGQPLSALVGGRFRGHVPVYASGIPAATAAAGDEGQQYVAEQAEALRAKGFDAVKVAIGFDPDGDVRSVTTVRDVLGAGGRVFADAAGGYDVRQALRVGGRLQDLGVGFFEMPLPPERVADYAFLAQRLDIPLALDSLATRHRALDFLRAGALHVLQPDVCRAGGVTETMRIATIADAFGAQTTPHVSIGSAVHFAASLHCASAMPNTDVLEHWVGANPLAQPLAPDLDEPRDGRRHATAGPGLGITIDAEAVRRLAG